MRLPPLSLALLPLQRCERLSLSLSLCRLRASVYGRPHKLPLLRASAAACVGRLSWRCCWPAPTCAMLILVFELHAKAHRASGPTDCTFGAAATRLMVCVRVCVLLCLLCWCLLGPTAVLHWRPPHSLELAGQQMRRPTEGSSRSAHNPFSG